MITRKRFLADVAKHQLTVLKDDGLYRHLRCAKPGSSNCAFEITTWPRYLAITGDMGDYVFHRTEDMFRFFRGAGLNPDYLQEKCVAGGRRDAKYLQQRVVASGREGVMCFDGDTLAIDIWEQFLEWLEEYWHYLTREQRREVWDEIKSLTDSIKTDTDGHESYRAVWEYRYAEGGRHVPALEFSDMGAYNRPTGHFVWCCQAILWCIEKYDESKEGGI